MDDFSSAVDQIIAASEVAMDKAAHVEDFYEAYLRRVGDSGELETNFTDMIADLLLLARIRGGDEVSIKVILGSAEIHADAEWEGRF